MDVLMVSRITGTVHATSIITSTVVKLQSENPIENKINLVDAKLTMGQGGVI